MDKITHCINHNRFIPVDTEELTALELIGKNVEKTNELVNKSNDHEEKLNKKVSYEDMKNVYKITTDNGTDYRGMWCGLKEPTISNEGLRAQVEKNRDDIAEHEVEITNISNELIKSKKIILPNGLDDTENLQNALNTYETVELTQKGQYTITSTLICKSNTIITNNATIFAKGCNGIVINHYVKTIGRLTVKGEGVYTQEYMSATSNAKLNPYSTFTGVQIGLESYTQAMGCHSSIDEIIVRGFNVGVDVQRIWGLTVNKIEVMHNQTGLRMYGTSVNSPLADIDIKYVMCYSNGLNIDVDFWEYGCFGTIQCMEHRDVPLQQNQRGIRFSNMKSITINNLWLEFYNTPSDLVGVGSPSGAVKPGDINGVIKYPIHMSTCAFLNFQNVYIHKARLGFYIQTSSGNIIQNVYHTPVSGKLTLGGKEYQGSFIQYGYGMEKYKNTYINTPEPIIARNGGNATYQGGFNQINHNGIVVEDLGKRLEIRGDNIKRYDYDTTGTVLSNEKIVIT